VPGPVPDEQEERDRDAPEGHELGVRARHAVALAVDAAGALFLDQPLEGKVGGLAGELAGEGERYLSLAGRPDEGCVDDAEGLGEEGEPGADVGDVIVGILDKGFPLHVNGNSSWNWDREMGLQLT